MDEIQLAVVRLALESALVVEEFIDLIAAIEADPRYRRLRIINILEPRWVRNAVVGVGFWYENPRRVPGCRRGRQPG